VRSGHIETILGNVRFGLWASELNGADGVAASDGLGDAPVACARGSGSEGESSLDALV
jgi:hypothetical protein